MVDRKAQNRFSDGWPDLHPVVGEFVAAIDALVDERLTDDEVEARLERLRVKRRHLQRSQGVEDAQAAATAPASSWSD